MDNITIVGEVVAGEASHTRKAIDALIQGLSSNTFDLAELLQAVKSKKFYLTYGHDTFGQYAKSLSLRTTKSYYLVRIVETMQSAGIPRTEYEGIGIAKLRVITKIDLIDKEGKVVEFDGLPMADYIKELVSKAKDMPLEDVEKVISHLQGKTDEDETVWINIGVKKIVRDKVIVPALSLAKMNIGTTGTDSDGKAIDASDGRALEVLAAEYLADPANGAEQIAPVKEIIKDGEVVTHNLDMESQDDN